MSVAAYKQTIKETESPRRIEMRIFSRITGALEKYVGVSADNFDNGAKTALWDNQRLWIALRADLVLPENQLPPVLRAQLISLGMWVDKQTTKVLKGEAGIETLIEINKNIISGLAGNNK